MPESALKWMFLPGLDGTGKLFDPVLGCLPRGVAPIVVRYPTDISSNADALMRLIEASLPREDFVVVAESFSGPLALRLARFEPPGLRALVLCATFAESPIPKAVASLLALGARAVHPQIQVPKWLLRHCLLQHASDALVDRLQVTLSEVSAQALASRFRVLTEFDAMFAPRTVDLPALYIRATRDRIVHVGHLERLRTRLPRLVATEMNAPHLALQCKPDSVVEVIVKFLASAER